MIETETKETQMSSEPAVQPDEFEALFVMGVRRRGRRRGRR